MSSMTWPNHLLTLDEWDALPDEDVYRHAELVEGKLQMSPSPTAWHQLAVHFLTGQLNVGLRSAALIAVPDVDVLLIETFPATVRAPDVTVVPLLLARSRPQRITASDVALAVEVVSPGSIRTDRITKLADYADAGIPNYWIVDVDNVDGQVALDAFRLVDGRYEPAAASATGAVTLDEPAPVTIDLAALVP